MPNDVVVLRADDERRRSLTESGWRVTARSWAARLDVTPAHVPAWEAALAHLDASRTCRELGEADVPATLGLDAATAGDYPGGPATAHAPLTAQRALPGGGRRGFGVFDDNDTLVAMTFVDVDGDRAEVDFTVVAAHRRREGLATAVKAASLLALARDGVRLVRTGGSEENRGSLATNGTLGFSIDERWLTLEAPATDVPEHAPEGQGRPSWSICEE
jgi:hypothetical protein